MKRSKLRYALANPQTEKLKPGLTLNFKASQSDLVKKYNLSMRDHNYNNLRVFFIILCCEYILQIVLHVIFRDDLKGTQTNSVKSNVYVRRGLDLDIDYIAFSMPRSSADNLDFPFILLQKKRKSCLLVSVLGYSHSNRSQLYYD